MRDLQELHCVLILQLPCARSLVWEGGTRFINFDVGASTVSTAIPRFIFTL
jgi:hypothetical protein